MSSVNRYTYGFVSGFIVTTNWNFLSSGHKIFRAKQIHHTQQQQQQQTNKQKMICLKYLTLFFALCLPLIAVADPSISSNAISNSEESRTQIENIDNEKKYIRTRALYSAKSGKSSKSGKGGKGGAKSSKMPKSSKGPKSGKGGKGYSYSYTR